MPSSNNKVIIASAGSRKTTYVVEEALGKPSNRILLTTYTNENVDQINSYIIQRKGYIPENIAVISWFSFLLQDGVRPYQNHMTDRDRIITINFTATPNRYVPKTDTDRYYLTDGNNIYRDRVADFMATCNSRSNGLIIKRLERIYDHIFIDEFQDLASFDLVFLESLFRSTIQIVAVGDPRQTTFSTNNANKYKQYKRSGILDWVEVQQKANILIMEERVDCYRSNQAICDFADALFPDMPKTQSHNSSVTGHDGVISISPDEVSAYVKEYKPVVLRYSKVAKTLGLRAFNIGSIKGRTFDRVLIFPTEPMKKYLKTKNIADAGDLSKLYVGATRARYSVAFVV